MPRPAIAIALPANEAAPVAAELREAGYEPITITRPDQLEAVLAERREQPGPQVRYSDKLRETFFAGQPLAERSPIGQLKTLEAATPDSVRAFHDRWYRPENTVVIISGDLAGAAYPES